MSTTNTPAPGQKPPTPPAPTGHNRGKFWTELIGKTLLRVAVGRLIAWVLHQWWS